MQNESALSSQQGEQIVSNVNLAVLKWADRSWCITWRKVEVNEIAKTMEMSTERVHYIFHIDLVMSALSMG